MNGFKLPFDLAMLLSHHNSRALFRPAGFLLPQRKQRIFFPDDMTLQAELELLEHALGLGRVRPLQLLKGLEQLIQPAMVLLVKLANGFLLTHDGSISSV